MTVDQIIKAFLDGGITLGMLALFAWMIIKLPAMMRESIELATAPTTEALRALARHIEQMQSELERLSVLVFLSHDNPDDRGGVRSVLRATGIAPPDVLRATDNQNADAGQ